MSITIKNEKMFGEAKKDLASGQLTPEDAAVLQAAVDAYSGSSGETGETRTGDTSFLQWRPGAEEAGPIPAENFSEPTLRSEEEAAGLQEAVESGALDDAPPGLLKQIGGAVSGWWTGGKEKTPEPTGEEESAGEPLPQLAQDEFAPTEPEFDENGPIIQVAPAESNVDSWRSSLSKDARFYAPPANFASDGGVLSNLKNEVFYEPNVRNVQNILDDSPELREAVGASEGDKVSADSDAYKKAADLMWRAKYLSAKEQNINVVRYSQIKDELPSFMKALAWVGEKAYTPLMQGVLAADRTATAGLLQGALGAAMGQGDELAALRESAHPGISIPAGIGGAMVPGAAGVRAVSRGVSAAPGIAGALGSAKMLPKMMGGAAVGAGTGMIEGAVQDMGDSMFGLTDGLTPEEFAARRANDALFGGVLGGLGGGATHGAQVGMRALRRKHRGLGVIEEAGGQTAWKGIDLPPGMRAREKAYDDNPLDTPDPARQVVDELSGPIEQAGRGRVSGALEKIQRENEEFFQSTAGKQQVAPKPLWDTAVDLMRYARKDGAEGAWRDAIPIQKNLARMTEAKLVRGRMAGQETMDQSEARKVFGDAMVDRLLDREVKLQERGTLSSPGMVSSPLGTRPSDVIESAQAVANIRKQLQNARIAVKPKAVDARTLEDFIDNIQSRAKVWRESQQGDVPAQMFNRLHASSLESRKLISPKWAQTKAQHSELLGDTGRTLHEAGLPAKLSGKKRGQEGYEPISVDERKRLEGTLMGAYDTVGQYRAATRALRSLADDVGLRKKLLELAAHREVEKLRGAERQPSVGAGITGGSVRAYGYDPKIWDKAAMRVVDPQFRRLARIWRAGESMVPAAALASGNAPGAALTEDEQDARALFIAMDMAKVLQEHQKARE